MGPLLSSDVGQGNWASAFSAAGLRVRVAWGKGDLEQTLATSTWNRLPVTWNCEGSGGRDEKPYPSRVKL